MIKMYEYLNEWITGNRTRTVKSSINKKYAQNEILITVFFKIWPNKMLIILLLIMRSLWCF